MKHGQIFAIDINDRLIRITLSLLIDNIVDCTATDHSFDIIGDNVIDFAVGSKPGDVYYLIPVVKKNSKSFKIVSITNCDMSATTFDTINAAFSDLRMTVLTCTAKSDRLIFAGNRYKFKDVNSKLNMVVCLADNKARLIDMKDVLMDRQTIRDLPGDLKIVKVKRLEVAILQQYQRLVFMGITKNRILLLNNDSDVYSIRLNKADAYLGFQPIEINRRNISLLVCTDVDLRVLTLKF